tara:strand:+ start:1002 stop:1313 length:312 start_codon:yes stop_codon:yes gene_type:complete
MVNMTDSEELIQIEKMSIDQFAGSIVLILGAVGSLLLVVWQSRCGIHCRLGCSDKCYLCDCKRDPPPLKEDKKKKGDEENPKEEEPEASGAAEAEEEELVPNT